MLALLISVHFDVCCFCDCIADSMQFVMSCRCSFGDHFIWRSRSQAQPSSAHQNTSIHISTDQYTSVHISTHQYTSAHISAHQYTSVQVRSSQYKSVPSVQVSTSQSVFINISPFRVYPCFVMALFDYFRAFPCLGCSDCFRVIPCFDLRV